MNFYCMRIIVLNFFKSEGNGNEISFFRSIIIWVGILKKEKCFYRESLYINERGILGRKYSISKGGFCVYLKK